MNKKHNKGAVLILTLVLFITVSLTIVMGLLSPVLHGYRITQDILNSKRSYFASESGVEDVLYRLKTSQTLSTSETLVLGTQEAVTTITDLTSTQKQIVSLGESKNRERKLSLVVEQGAGVAFNYGVQAGRGGFVLSGSSGINGSIYANGNIVATGSPYITGSAIAADTEALTADQSNGIGVPSNSITFGNTSSTQDLAQSFTVSAETPLNKVQFYIRKNGNPSNATVRIYSDNSGSPATNYLATGTLSASLVTTSYGWIDVVFNTNPVLQTGVTYWVVIDASSSSSNYYVMGANANGYTGGQAKIGNSSTWSNTTPAGLDIFFKIFLGGLTSSITGDSQYNRLRVGTSGTGSASARTVNNTSAPTAIYCQSGTGNNQSCNTSQPVPTPQGWPVSDANIDAWKAEALLGGTTTGNINAGSGWQTVSMGPQKIVGNLSVGGSATLNVTGTLWITGNLTVDGAGRLKLASSYGASSGTIIVDGRVTIGGSSPVTGSGTNGSYILLVSLSDCPTSSSCGSSNAVDISGSAGAVVLIAQNGTIKFSGSASAKQATGYKITLEGGTSVTYESGLANLTFTSGPSGSWNVSSWRETE